MTRLSRTLALLTILIGAAWPTQAAVYPGEWFISGGIGVLNGHRSFAFQNVHGYEPGTGLTSEENVGLQVGGLAADYSGELLYHVTPKVGFGLKAMAPEFKGYRLAPNLALSKYNEEVYQAVARYVFFPERDWYPYILGGAGFSNSFLDDFVKDDNGFVFQAGHGAKIFTSSIALGLEGGFGGAGLVGLELGVLYTPAMSSATSNGSVQYSSLLAPYLNLRLGFDFGGSGRQ